jgi:hypothetical protein
VEVPVAGADEQKTLQVTATLVTTGLA